MGLKNYQSVTLDELKAMMPLFDWNRYLAATEFDTPEKLIIMQRDFLQSIDAVIANVSVADWKIFLQWSLLNNAAGILTEQFDQA